jgi:hypothetical protein
MTSPDIQVLSPPPSPRYTVYASRLEVGDTIASADLAATPTTGWVLVDPALVGHVLTTDDTVEYVRPVVRS